MFSIYIGNSSNDSSNLMLGGYDSFKVNKDDHDGYGIHWYETESEEYWDLEIDYFEYGD